MKAGIILLVTCLLALPLGGCTDDRIVDPIDQIDQDELRTDLDGVPNNGDAHNTQCTNTSPQPCPCNANTDCPTGFYCQPADSTPLYGYCWPKPPCNAGEPNCPPSCNAGDPNCD